MDDNFNLDTMTDEDILKFDISKFDDASETDTSVVAPPTEEVLEDVSTTTEEVVDETTEDSSDETTEETTEESPENSDTTAVAKESVDSDMAAQIANLMKGGFKVGKNNVSVNSVEELRTLVQRGLGANKRMQELKPSLKLLQTLQTHNLDQDKLNFAIDLLNNKPEAIAELLRKGNIDPLDVDTSKGYTPTNYSIPDAQFNLQQVMEEHQDSPVYADTVEVIKRMDTKSRYMVGESPQRFATLIEDMGTQYDGTSVYDQVSNIVVSEQAKGNYQSLSFLEAYEKVTNVLKEQLVAQGIVATTHNQSLANYLNVVAENGTTPHKTNHAKVGGQGSNTMQSKHIGNTQNVEAAKKAANIGSQNKQGSKKNAVLDLNKLSAEEISKLPITAFD